MQRLDDPSLMTPDERLSEIATILTRGILRLSSPTSATNSETSGNISPSSQKPLDLSAKSRLSVHTG